MISTDSVTMLNTSLSFIQTTFSDDNHEQTLAQNTSPPEGCITLEFLPWDNPDNIISAEVDTIMQRIKNTSLVFLFLIGGPGNLINMAVFYKQSLKDRVNLCLFALALADELYLITVMCHHAEQLHIQFTTKENYGPMHSFMINNYLTGFVGFSFASYGISAIIACERCLCVLNPLRFQALMSTRTMAAIILVVYVVVVGLFFFVTFRYHIGCVYDPVSDTVIKTHTQGEFYKAHKVLLDTVNSVVFGAGLPVVVIIAVMIATGLTIGKLRQVVSWRATTSSSISPREVALTKMLVGNSILFIACVFPISVTRFMWLFFPEISAEGRNQNFYLTSIWINQICSYINSSLNIFVYYAMGSRYRETFRTLLCRKEKPQKT